MIEVRNLSYSYPGEEKAAVQHVSLRICRGERVCLMGANGSGKTTLIRCLNGLFQPTAGRVRVDGLFSDNEDDIYEIRRRVGMVFQNPDNQIVTTTVERELAFGLENLGLSRQLMEERISKALISFGLVRYRHTSPHLLSGGERQRLALAAIQIMEPEYLILDEPTTLLDPRTRREVIEMLDAEMGGRELGIVNVTQSPDEALDCDRLLVMNRGKLMMDDTPERVFRQVDRLRGIGLDIPVSVELDMFLEQR